MKSRTLALKREVVAEIADADLRRIAAAAPDEGFSSLTYVSCHITDCILSEYGYICVDG